MRMRTPSRVGWNEFQASVRSFYNDCYRRSNTSEPPVCKKCGSEIASIIAFMDVHDERLRDSCAGPGRVSQFPSLVLPSLRRQACHSRLHPRCSCVCVVSSSAIVRHYVVTVTVGIGVLAQKRLFARRKIRCAN